MDTHDEAGALPSSITLDEAFRAAFYMIHAYIKSESQPGEDLILLEQYMWSDPARWDDWKAAVFRALNDGGLANADHDGQWGSGLDRDRQFPD